jgi:hypothetical protein
MSKRVDSVDVVVAVPKQVIAFLKAHVQNPQQYIAEALLRVFEADITTSDHFFFQPENLIQLYNLEKILDC